MRAVSRMQEQLHLFLADLQNYVTAGLILTGSLVMLVSCIGMARLPDFYTRSHAVGKGMTLGISLLLIGLWAAPTPQVAGLKIFVAIFFQFVTIPVASHLLMQLAYRRQERRRGIAKSS